MIQCGEPPYLECSSRGDKRFSAFYARPRSLNGRSIEEAFQSMKLFEDGKGQLVSYQDWRQAKGRHGCVNYLECAAAYTGWWREWVTEQSLMPVLLAATGLSDIFGQGGHVCQATVLWNLRQEALDGQVR